MSSIRPLRGNWSASMGFLICLFFLGWIHMDTLLSMIRIWIQSDTFGHCFFVPVISGYLLWRNRSRGRSSLSDRILAILATVAFSLVWAMGALVDVLVVTQFMLVSMVLGLVFLFFGYSFFLKNLFPLLFLYFVVPVGNFLVDPLVDLTAYTTVELVSLSGIPVFRDGIYFSVPNGNFEVADACSGVRFLIVSIVLGGVFAYLTFESQWKRWLFVLGLIALSIVANTIRAYLIVVIAYYSDFRIGVGDDHLFYGWIFFGVVLFFSFWVGARFADEQDESRQCYESFAPMTMTSLLVLSSLALVVIAGGSYLPGNRLAKAHGNIGERPVPQLPVSLSSWTNTGSKPDWQTTYQGELATQIATYRGAAGEVSLMLIHYGLENQGGELVNSQNLLYNKESWGAARQTMRLVTLPNQSQRKIDALTLVGGGNRRMIWFWHDVAGTTVAGGARTKLQQLLAILMGNYDGASVLAVAVDYQFDDGKATSILTDFLSENWGEIQQCIRRPGSQCVDTR
ncbi:MAG: exosortase A [Pseudomonadota bacterium]